MNLNLASFSSVLLDSIVFVLDTNFVEFDNFRIWCVEFEFIGLIFFMPKDAIFSHPNWILKSTFSLLVGYVVYFAVSLGS